MDFSPVHEVMIIVWVDVHVCVKTEYCKVSGDYENWNLKTSMLERGI